MHLWHGVTMVAMQKWQYAIAEYDGGIIEARIDFPDVPISGDVLPFLNEAGEKGWELCGTLPSPELKTDIRSAKMLALVFKRPVS
jgi:hypothetical protein